MNFVTTTDLPTAQLLRQAGLKEVPNSNNMYTFVNSPILTFASEIDKKKITYSNKLCI